MTSVGFWVCHLQNVMKLWHGALYRPTVLSVCELMLQRGDVFLWQKQRDFTCFSCVHFYVARNPSCRKRNSTMKTIRIHHGHPRGALGPRTIKHATHDMRGATKTKTKMQAPLAALTQSNLRQSDQQSPLLRAAKVTGWGGVKRRIDGRQTPQLKSLACRRSPYCSIA